MVYVDRSFLTSKEEEVTGKRYCTSCQWTRPLEGGKKTGSRWVCASCIDNRNKRKPSQLYKGKK